MAMGAGERLRLTGDWRQMMDLRALRVGMPDSRSEPVRRRVAMQVAGLDQRSEKLKGVIIIGAAFFDPLPERELTEWS
jgi:hypothetical protein